MNWEDYLDPYLNKQEYWSNTPASDPTIRAPRMSDYPVETLKAPDRTLGDWLGDMFFPETRDYLTTGQGKPGIVGEWADSIGGKIGSLAKAGFAASKGLPALAGLVEMGGKRYPQAYLHRSIDPKELEYFEELAVNNVKSTKPMSMVVPRYAPLFRKEEDDVGLLFNARQDELHKLWTHDVGSTPHFGGEIYENKPKINKYLDAQPGTEEAKDLLRFYSQEVLGDIFHAANRKGKERAVDSIISAMRRMEPRGSQSQLYNNKGILDAIINREKMKGDVIPYDVRHIGTEMWGEPFFERSLSPNTTTLEDYFSKMLDDYSTFGEIVADYGKANLAGVRVSKDSIKKPGWPTKTIIDFADRNNVPVFAWNEPNIGFDAAIDTIAQIGKGGQLGNWGTKQANIPGMGNRGIKYPINSRRW